MSNNEVLSQQLNNLLESNRIVIWRDVESDYTSLLGEIELQNAWLIRVDNNEFGIKFDILHARPNDKFVLYVPGPRPEDKSNWLLDIEKCYKLFIVDETSITNAEFGDFGSLVGPLIAEFPKFFKSEKRKEILLSRLLSQDSSIQVKAKMLSIACGTLPNHRLSSVVMSLLQENASGENKALSRINDWGLDEFLWKGISDIYGYKADVPTVDDFVFWLFKSASAGFEPISNEQNRQIQQDFSSWRHDVRFIDSFRELSQRSAIQLDVKSAISETSIDEIGSDDLFADYDRRILTQLLQSVVSKSIPLDTVTNIARIRKQSIWSSEFSGYFDALVAAATFFASINKFQPSFTTFDEGISKYVSEYQLIDESYRHFLTAEKDVNNPEILAGLKADIEAHYANKYLLVLGNAWQQKVDSQQVWTSGIKSQLDFYKSFVEPRLSIGNNKVVVIISDALRYEISNDLISSIRAIDRFEATVEPVLGALPSYTQLGMAALLPHSNIEFSGSGDSVNVDGKSAAGTANRSNILASVGGIAIQADDIFAADQNLLRQLFKDNQVIYVYHNVIDATGDKKNTESKVFGAVQTAIDEISQLIKRFTNANASNILITADHGFLYQHNGLEQNFYLSEAPKGEIIYQGRRHVIGSELEANVAFNKYSSSELGLSGELEVQIPKSINRLRLKGSGSRFVHGGSALQEIIVPVISVNKKRSSDVGQVDIDIVATGNSITTNQISLKLVQTAPVTDKTLSRKLQAAVYANEVLLTEIKEFSFTSQSDEARDRIQEVVLFLTGDAVQFNHKQIQFVLKEQIPNTNQFKTYSSKDFTLNLSFVADF